MRWIAFGSPLRRRKASTGSTSAIENALPKFRAPADNEKSDPVDNRQNDVRGYNISVGEGAALCDELTKPN
jgi:hypothetical protein